MSGKNKDKSTLKEKINIIKRTTKTVNTADPGCITRKLAEDIPVTINHYAGVYLASLVIDGVTSAKPVSFLLIAAVIVCGIELLTNMISRTIRMKNNCHEFSLNENLGKLLWKKALTLDYAKAESIETQNKYRTAKNYINNQALTYHIRYLDQLVCGFFKLIIGIILISPIVFSTDVNVSHGGFIGFVQSGWGFAAVLAAAAAVISVNAFVITPFALRSWNKFNIDPWLNSISRVGQSIYSRCVYNYRTGKDIRLYNEQDLMISKYSYVQNEFVKAWTSSMKTGNKCYILMRALNALLTFATYGFAIIRAVSGMISPGEVVAFAMYFSTMRAGFDDLSACISNLLERAEHCKSIFNFLDIPDEKYKGTIPTEKRDDNEYEFEFRHVYFKYPKTEEYVLKDISLKWRIGEKMALVGRNGSGKSTLIKLLCRLYDPTEGEILLNGIDIRKYSLQEYTDLFSVVFQDSELFAFSIGENTAVDTEYDKALVEECVRKAGFSERLDECPDGLDTCLYKDFDEKGVEISGGEIQKLCLARAVYKGAPFIVLDEPTAALDPLSEYDIYTKFNSIVGTRTAVYISHRLSSCSFCDDITVLDNGKIAERGNHDSLIAGGGVYAEMWSAQAEYYKTKAEP